MQEDMTDSTQDTSAEEERLTAEFSAWMREGLSLVSSCEEPVESPSLPEVDLFTLYGEMKGIREDIKRDLKRNAAFIDEFRDGLTEIRSSVGERKSEEVPVERYIEPLFDLYDRVTRLVPLVQKAIRSKEAFLRLLGLHHMLKDLLESHEILLLKCESQFQALGIEVHGKPGEVFNPLVMKAVAADERGKDGTVYDVVHLGFSQEGRLFFPAEVIVSKKTQR
jgi:molecular chaperone GrpE (heat shock protein)